MCPPIRVASSSVPPRRFPAVNASTTLSTLTTVSSEHVIKLDPSLVNVIFDTFLKCAVNDPRNFPEFRSQMFTSPDRNPIADVLQREQHTTVGVQLKTNRFTRRSFTITTPFLASVVVCLLPGIRTRRTRSSPRGFGTDAPRPLRDGDGRRAFAVAAADWKRRMCSMRDRKRDQRRRFRSI